MYNREKHLLHAASWPWVLGTDIHKALGGTFVPMQNCDAEKSGRSLHNKDSGIKSILAALRVISLIPKMFARTQTK